MSSPVSYNPNALSIHNACRIMQYLYKTQHELCVLATLTEANMLLPPTSLVLTGLSCCNEISLSSGSEMLSSCIWNIMLNSLYYLASKCTKQLRSFYFSYYWQYILKGCTKPRIQLFFLGILSLSSF